MKVHADIFSIKSGSWFLHIEFEENSFIGLNPHYQLITGVFPRFSTEKMMRSLFKVDDYFSYPCRKSFTCPDIKRHTAPTPVIYEKLHCNISFGSRISRNFLF